MEAVRISYTTSKDEIIKLKKGNQQFRMELNRQVSHFDNKNQ